MPAAKVAQSPLFVVVALAGMGGGLNPVAAAPLYSDPFAVAGRAIAIEPSAAVIASSASSPAHSTLRFKLATLTAAAPTLTPAPTPVPPTLTPAPTLTPVPPTLTPVPPGSTSGPIVPGSLSGAPAQSAPASRGPAAGSAPPREPPNGGVQPAGPAAGTPRPVPSPSGAPAPGRFHLHRPGTDIDGDLLTGNAVSDVYIFRGNVVLHSDPKIDRSFSAATESDEPLTVTADELDVDRAALTYVAKGHVHFVQGDRAGRADTAMLNEQTHSLDLLGNADVNEGDRRARAAKLHYDLADRQFHGAGEVRLYQPLPTPNPQPSTTPAPKRRRRLPIPV